MALRLSLRPYHGTVLVCSSLEELRALYQRRTRRAYPYDESDDPQGGRYVMLEGEIVADTLWLVYAADLPALAHEFAHVLLHTFRRIGHDPCNGDGEPFCYMLSQLLLEAKSMRK